MKRIYKFLVTTAIVITALAALSLASSAAGKWIGAWSTAMTNISLKDYGNISFTGSDLTGRTVVTPTASGTKLRLRFSNHYGSKDIVLDSISIARSVSSTELTSGIDIDTITPVSFGGRYKNITIPAGKEIVSDAVAFKVNALENLAISYYLKDSAEIKTMGLSGGATYISTEGDKTSQQSFNIANNLDEELYSFLESFGISKFFDRSLSVGIVSVVPLLSGLDVYSDENAYSVCVIGDSTIANQFPQYLAENIIKNNNTKNVGVLGKGIIGNTLTTISEGSLGAMVYGEPLIERFERDCLNQSNVKYAIVKIGANDIMHPVCTNAADGAKQPSANEIIANLQTICDMAHAKGVKVILGTITQWKGTKRDYFKALGIEGTYQRTEAEEEADWAIAQKVNKWIKASDNTYHDGYFDFAAISKSSADPAALDSAYSDDHIHPNGTLQRLWGDEFNMSLIGVSTKLAQIRLSASTLKINVGASKTIKVVGTIPSNAANKNVTWTSSNPAVATVSSSGKVTAAANGTTTITATAADGSKVKATCKVTVVTPVSSVSVTPASKTIYTRDKLTLKATVAPSNATNKSITWTSSDKTIATVSSKGVVTAVKSGTVKITVKTADGSKTAAATIKVKKRIDVAVIEMNVSKKSMYVGKTYQLTASVYPTDATYPELKWSSTDKAVATVDQTGKVTAVATGSCRIKIASVDNPSVYQYVTINVFKHVSSVKLSPETAIVTAGKTKQLTAKVYPSTAYNKDVTFKSSNKGVAKVSASGLVTGVAEGDCLITVTTVDGSFTATTTIHVIPYVKTTGVKLNAAKKTLYVKDKFTLSATVSPANASDKSVTWISSDTSVAKVSAKGVVTAVSKGTATIFCSTKDSGKTAKCVVTVKNVIPTKVTLSYPKLSLDPGKSTTLRATISPSNATIKTVKWTSSNTKIAKVSSSGKVTAVKAGKCTITCTTVSGKRIAKCAVTVNPIKVKTIKLSVTSMALNVGVSKTVKATVSPSNATNKGVTWKSSNTKVATVSSSGVVKAVGKGTATITCTAKDGSGVKATAKVTVKAVKVIGVNISKTSATLSKGGTLQLSASCLPTNATNKSIRWTSSNTAVATVSSTGKVTAVGRGECFIKAVAVDGGSVGACKVTVN